MKVCSSLFAESAVSFNKAEHHFLYAQEEAAVSLKGPYKASPTIPLTPTTFHSLDYTPAS